MDQPTAEQALRRLEPLVGELYCDERGVCRVCEMSIGNGE